MTAATYLRVARPIKYKIKQNKTVPR